MIWSCLHHFSCATKDTSGANPSFTGHEMYTIWGALLRKRCKNYEYKIKHKRYYFLKLEKKIQKAESYYSNPDNCYNISNNLPTPENYILPPPPLLAAYLLFPSAVLRYCKGDFQKRKIIEVPPAYFFFTTDASAWGRLMAITFIHPKKSTQWVPTVPPKAMTG